MTTKHVLVSMKRDLAAVKARPIRSAPEPSNKLSARDEGTWVARWTQFRIEIRNHEIQVSEGRIKHYRETGEIKAPSIPIEITP